jgi:membrane protease YdiL (CAAX protease family)
MRRRPDPSLAVAPWLALVLLVSWSFWFAAALAAGSADPRGAALARLGLYAGGLAPAVLAILALQRWCAPGVRAGFWRRLVDPRRLRASDWLRTLAPAPLAMVLAVAVAGAAGVPEPGSWTLPAHWWLPLFLIVFGPLPEELAWRGWALDRLQLTTSALAASLLLGTYWILWHLPLFLVEGTYQHGLGLGTPRFWLFCAVLLPQAVVLTWVYNTTRGSLLAAVLAHWSINLVGELVAIPVRTELLLVLVWTLMAAALVAALGPEALAREGTGAAARMGRGPGRRSGHGPPV